MDAFHDDFLTFAETKFNYFVTFILFLRISYVCAVFLFLLHTFCHSGLPLSLDYLLFMIPYLIIIVTHAHTQRHTQRDRERQREKRRKREIVECI